jgi:multidrug efflux pump subunit AcrA (membrane-fusion protein)
MKLSKTTAAIAVGLIIVFVVSVLYLYNRDVRRIETIAVAEIRAKIEKEEAAKREKERAELEAKIALHEKEVIYKTQLYEDARTDAAKERAAKEAARRANASLDASWQIKYSNESKAHGETIEAWAASDKLQAENHAGIVAEFNMLVDDMKRNIGTLQKDQDEKAKTILDLKASLALEKRKSGRRLVWGAYVGGGIDKKASAGIGIMYYIGRIG